MRYKKNIEQKLEKIANLQNLVKHHSQRGEQLQVNQYIDTIKEEIDNIQTLLNNEIQE
tara:strand:- start:1181 stop:1354 length:174 start_codon:yes stop_codon:yes gene_type:complete